MAFTRILVPLDGSQAAESALPHAANLASAFGARLYLLRVLDISAPGNQPDSIDWRLQKAEARRYLHGLASAQPLKDLSVTVEIDEGRPAECILKAGKNTDADLIVMSAYGASGASGFPFGGTAHKILSRASRSVAIVREVDGSQPGRRASYKRVLVPIDGSQRSEMALQLVLAMTSDNPDLDIVVLHLVSEPRMPRRVPLSPEERALRDQVIASNQRAAELHLGELKRQFQSGPRIEFKTVVTGQPIQAIIKTAREEKVDLMVITSPDAGPAAGLSREGMCQAIQAVSELPMVVLQTNGSD